MLQLIGAFSDKCTSRFGKRRPFIVVAGLLTCISMLGVAYAKEFGAMIAYCLYPDEQEQASSAVSSSSKSPDCGGVHSTCVVADRPGPGPSS